MAGLTTERFFAELPNSLFHDCEQLARDSLAGSADDLNAFLTVAYLRGQAYGSKETHETIRMGIRKALLLDMEYSEPE